MLNIDIKLGTFDSVTKQTSKITLIWQLLLSSGNVTTSLNIKLNVILKKISEWKSIHNSAINWNKLEKNAQFSF